MAHARERSVIFLIYLRGCNSRGGLLRFTGLPGVSGSERELFPPDLLSIHLHRSHLNVVSTNWRSIHIVAVLLRYCSRSFSISIHVALNKASSLLYPVHLSFPAIYW
jgi:hypothetical protein